MAQSTGGGSDIVAAPPKLIGDINEKEVCMKTRMTLVCTAL